MVYTAGKNQTQNKTVLVIEDDPSIREMVALALQTETSYHVVCAKNAFQALQMVEQLLPDLFILDYHLPHMNGIELYDRLHAQAAFKQTPTLFMSANAPRDALQKRHLSCIDKPFEVETMVQRVEELLAA